MKYSQAILVTALGTSAFVAAVPLPTQKNNDAGPVSTTVSNASTNPVPAAVQGTLSSNGANKSSSSANNQSGTVPTPVPSTTSGVNPDSGNATPTRRDIDAIDMGLLTRVIQNELDVRGYSDDSAIIARDLANDYALWPRGQLTSDVHQLVTDARNVPVTAVANSIQGTQQAVHNFGARVQNFVNNHATSATSGGTGGTMSGTASPGATFRRDLELNARNVPGDSGTLKSMTSAARDALKQGIHRHIDDYSNQLKDRVSTALGSSASVTHQSSYGNNGEEHAYGGIEPRAPGQEGASSLTSDLLNKRRNVEEYSVHERDFEDYDIYGRDLEIANLD
ncbi:hypothetical protein H0H93_007143 [Arthromyces matolae]|nr:hypothetical protein H0H93_007143 [Arthromyces matolae]